MKRRHGAQHDSPHATDASSDRSVATSNQAGANPEFAVDLAVQLALPGKKEAEQAFSRILGWKVGRFVLVELPSRDGRAVEVRTGATCVVRYMREGRVVGFATTISRVQFTPDALLFSVSQIRRGSAAPSARARVDLLSSSTSKGRKGGFVGGCTSQQIGLRRGRRAVDGAEVGRSRPLRALRSSDVQPARHRSKEDQGDGGRGEHEARNRVRARRKRSDAPRAGRLARAEP